MRVASWVANLSCFRIRRNRNTSKPHTPSRTRKFRTTSPLTKSCTAVNMAETRANADMAGSSNAARSVDSSAVAEKGGALTVLDMAAHLSERQLAVMKSVSVGETVFVLKGTPEVEDEEDYDDEQDADGEDDDEADYSAAANGDGDEADNGENENEEEAPSAASQEDADENADNNSSDSDATLAPPVAIPHPPRMYVVTAITRNDKGDIADVQVKHLTYSKVANPDDVNSYQAYGNEIVHRHPDHGMSCSQGQSIATILTHSNCVAMASPQGDYVRRFDPDIATNPHRRCISGCANGWLSDRTIVDSLIANHTSPVLAWGETQGDLDDIPLQHAVCPVCIGLPHLKDQERLQHTLLTVGSVSIEQVITFESTLNPRRTALGYTFTQFDERLWGFHFDDMSDGEEGEAMDGGWHDPFEHFPEALDPNANIKFKPAAEASIQALPRKLWGEISKDVGQCDVCTDPVLPDHMVIVLPCGHSEHHAACLELWLRQQETCTVCRRVIPVVKEAVVPAMPTSAGSSGEEESEEGRPENWSIEEVAGTEAGWESLHSSDDGGAGADQVVYAAGAGDMHPGFPSMGQYEAIARGQLPSLVPIETPATFVPQTPALVAMDMSGFVPHSHTMVPVDTPAFVPHSSSSWVTAEDEDAIMLD